MSVEPLLIQNAEAHDMQRVTEIYSHYVRNSVATFEVEPPDVQEMLDRHAKLVANNGPYLVAQCGDTILGYAYAGAYRTRPAYKFTVENSVYLDPTATGNGIGTALLNRLIAECQARGFKEMVAIIGGGNENESSARLHARCGFVHVGVLKRVGYKFDRWVDTLLMQRGL